MSNVELQLKGMFLEEAGELLSQAEEVILKLEQVVRQPDSGSPKTGLETIFRITHNIKGSAQSSGFDQMARVGHALEELLTSVRQGKLPLRVPVLGVILEALDCLKSHVKGLRENFSYTENNDRLLQRLRRIAEG